MPALNNELKKKKKKGVSLEKPDAEELRKREEDKQKRLEELDKIKQALGEQ
ncbi:MAG: hypothetical protein ACTSQD_00855 [Promethearchaeota archaeon]